MAVDQLVPEWYSGAFDTFNALARQMVGVPLTNVCTALEV